VKIQDEIQDIVYRNEDNGYSVLRLKDSNTTAVGVFAFVSVGQEYVFYGEHIENAKYGRQFKIQSYELVPPNSPSKIRQFIGSGLIEGIGPVTADRIVKSFGKDTLKIMESASEELVAIRGISLRKAKIIGEKYAEIKQMQAAVMFLQRFEISINMAMRIFRHYGENTIKIVQENPYKLIESIDGVGFLTADKMAKDLGHEYSGTFRVRAGVVYTLKQSSEQDGNTYLPYDELFLKTCRLLKIKFEDLKPVFDGVLYELCLDKYLTQVNKESKDVNDNENNAARGYMLTKFFIAEKSIATNLSKLALNSGDEIKGDADALSALIAHYEKINKIKLHQTQIEAVKLALTSGVCVITGGPGTGKTTIVRAILYLNQASNLTTSLLAPTGRAAKRLEETTGREASTIHRALDIDYKNSPKQFGYEEGEGIDSDVVIVDEFSMCDTVLTSQLLKKISSQTRLIIVGDVDQLPSVGAGVVLTDIINSGTVPVVRLTEIYRQDEASQIVISAHKINNGEMPDLTNKSSDFFFESCDSVAKIRDAVVSLSTTRIPNYLKIPHSKIQVLCPMKVGEAGMNNLNIVLQESLNPSSREKSEYEYGQTTFRIGDRVMQTMNNYNQEWSREKDGIREMGEGVYNGDIGVIAFINRQNGEVVVELEDGRVTTYTRSDLVNVVLSYAITVHKSQGCEFDVVIIPVTSGAYMILTRNLLYTAVTRAKKMVILVGDVTNIEKMVNNTYTKKRHTMLREFLVEAKRKVEQIFDTDDAV